MLAQRGKGGGQSVITVVTIGANEVRAHACLDVVATKLGIILLLSSFFPSTYFSSGRGLPMIFNFCMPFSVNKKNKIQPRHMSL